MKVSRCFRRPTNAAGFLKRALGLVFATVALSGCLEKPSAALVDSFPDPAALDLANALWDAECETAKAIVDEGTPIDSFSVDGRSILLMLLDNSRGTDSVDCALKLGADPNLLNAKNTNNPIFASIKNYPDAEVLSLLIRSGGDVDLKTQQNPIVWFPIFVAILNQNHAALELLIDQGADIEVRNALNTTPLLTTLANQWETAYILIEAGADIYATSAEGSAPFWFVIENNRYYPPRPPAVDWRAKVVEQLAERGVHVKPWKPE